MKPDLLLAVDVGNTSVDYGLFSGRRLIKRGRSQTRQGWGPLLRSIRPVRRRILGSVVCSVVPAAVPSLKKALKKATGTRPLVVGQNIRVPIMNRTRRPREVGADRLVNALAGYRKHGGPLLILDFGTALTFDLVSARGAYLGGVIMPGLGIWLDALAERTALLPRIRVAKPVRKAPPLPGKTTFESLHSGALHGYSAMCEGMIARFRKLYGRQLRVIACGGQAKTCVSFCKSISYIDYNLTLKGLYLTYKSSRQDGK